MAFKQQRLESFKQAVLALAGVGAIAPGCIAFATGGPTTPAMEVAVQAQQPAVQSLKATIAPGELPFIGTRFFNFMGGTGTVESIEIQADGTTQVGLIGLYDSQELYSGPFTNPIQLNDGRSLRIKGDQIFQLLADDATANRCRIEQTPCSAVLQKPFAESAPPRL